MIERAGVKPTRIVASGGGSRVTAWMAAVADATNLPVDTVAVPEGAALGAAFFARLAAGLEASLDDSTRWSAVGRTIEPDAGLGTRRRRALREVQRPGHGGVALSLGRACSRHMALRQHHGGPSCLAWPPPREAPQPSSTRVGRSVPTATCTVTGVGAAGRVAMTVGFWNAERVRRRGRHAGVDGAKPDRAPAVERSERMDQGQSWRAQRL